MTRRERQGLYYLPEAARTLGITVRLLRKFLYAPTTRAAFTHRTRRAGRHPRRLRVLTPQDLDQLAHLIRSGPVSGRSRILVK